MVATAGFEPATFQVITLNALPLSYEAIVMMTNLCIKDCRTTPCESKFVEFLYFPF